LTERRSAYQINEEEMGRACGTYRGEKKCGQGFWHGNLNEREDLLGL